MAHKSMTTLNERQHDERGLSLIETMIAAAILLIVVVGVLNLFTMAITTNQQQGNIATRTTEYAQDKMEQLMALSFNDRTSNTTVFPVVPLGGTGLASGGSIPPAAPVALYSDYLDDTGNLLAGAAGASYTRQWIIARVGSVPTLSAGVTGGGGSQQVGVTLPSPTYIAGGLYAGNSVVIDQGVLPAQETVILMTSPAGTITAAFLNNHPAGAAVGAISKTITLVVTSNVPGAVQGVRPSTTVVSIKSAGL